MMRTLVVGSGVAAAALSESLLRTHPGEEICLLEAGTAVKLRDYGLWESYLVSGRLPYQDYGDLDYPAQNTDGENVSAGTTLIPLRGARLMTYGGSTVHWGGWSLRMKPEDFRLGSNVGAGLPDWPFSYEDLEPYYCQAELYLGVSGDSADTSVPRQADYPYAAFPYTAEDGPFIDACNSLGLHYGHMPIARKGIAHLDSKQAPCQTTGTCKYCPFGARYAAPNFLNALTNWNEFPNFTIVTNAVVETLLMDSPTRARGVVYRDRGTGEHVTIEADRVIVAAGTIESAKLLLRSRPSGWPDGVGNTSGMVGRHFITHPYFVYDGRLPANPEALQQEMDFPTVISRHFDSPGEQAAGKFVLANPPGNPRMIDRSSGKATTLAEAMRNGTRVGDLRQMVTGPALVQIHGMVEVFPDRRNHVDNLVRVNRLGLHETQVNYSQAETFPHRQVGIGESVRDMFLAMGAVPAEQPPNYSWRADHAAATCRMSVDSQDGVVDPDLRVHGTENLYVLSNAVFPNLGAVNPTLTLTSLALRLADHLRSTA